MSNLFERAQSLIDAIRSIESEIESHESKKSERQAEYQALTNDQVTDPVKLVKQMRECNRDIELADDAITVLNKRVQALIPQSVELDKEFRAHYSTLSDRISDENDQAIAKYLDTERLKNSVGIIKGAMLLTGYGDADHFVEQYYPQLEPDISKNPKLKETESSYENDTSRQIGYFAARHKG